MVLCYMWFLIFYLIYFLVIKLWRWLIKFYEVIFQFFTVRRNIWVSLFFWRKPSRNMTNHNPKPHLFCSFASRKQLVTTTQTTTLHLLQQEPKTTNKPSASPQNIYHKTPFFLHLQPNKPPTPPFTTNQLQWEHHHQATSPLPDRRTPKWTTSKPEQFLRRTSQEKQSNLRKNINSNNFKFHQTKIPWNSNLVSSWATKITPKAIWPFLIVPLFWFIYFCR